jgi:hypothetical protein
MGEEIAIHVLEPVGYAKYVPRHPERSKAKSKDFAAVPEGDSTGVPRLRSE